MTPTGEPVEFDPLVTATRVFTTRPKRKKRERPKSRRLKRRLPFEALVFDTETTINAAQRLLFGVWRFYRDDPDGQPGVTCIEEGIFYPDDLTRTDPEGWKILSDYAEAAVTDAAPGFSDREFGRRVLLWPESKWLQERLYKRGYKNRDRCDIVGFNLLFDLTRVATHFGSGQGQYRGGWSLGIWGRYRGRQWRDRRYHPRFLAKPLDPRRTLFAWGSLAKKDRDRKATDARFVDLRTLAYALTDRSNTLETACTAFGDPFEKADVEYGEISRDLIHYGREDVAHTAVLYRNCLAELDRHDGIDLNPARLYSPATVGTQYLEAMGVAQPFKQFADLDPRIHGWAMAGFYGGRVEARIVRTPVPVAYVDMTSMYPTVNALLDTWPLLTADHVTAKDATEPVQRLLLRGDLAEACFDKDFWSDEIGVTLVELDHPDGLILPVRGGYDEAARDPRIGVNPLLYRGRVWYMLPDVIAAAILSEAAPQVSRAIRLRPDGRQALKAVPLRGGRSIDPLTEDPFVAFIEQRHRTKTDNTLTPEERDRLELFLKITANATSYGVLARFDRRNYAKPRTVTVYGPDDEPFDTKTTHPEDPGPYCFPPIATSITAAARLMLALLEQHVTNAGGAYAFCDTDSMSIVCHPTITHIDAPTPDGTNRIPVLTPDQVTEIIRRFDTLNPYDPDLIPHLWEPEHDSLTDPIWAHVISSKRYALYRQTDQGTAEFVDIKDESDADEMVDWSEHGLGAYLDPTGPEPERDEDKRRVWIRQVWEHVLTGDSPEPEWADTPALTRYTVNTPAAAKWFTTYNRNRPPRDRVRAGNFGLLAHPDPMTVAGELPRPTAPYETDPAKWLNLPWYDRRTGDPMTVTTLRPTTDPERFDIAIAAGATRIHTLGDILNRFPHHPEHKSLAADGAAVDRHAQGLLQRRPVESAPVLTDLIGKESNLLEERLTGAITDPDQYLETHGTRGDRWSELVVPVLNEMGAKEVMARTGRKKSAVYEAIAGRSRPTGSEAAPYRQAAAEWAAEHLRARSEYVPRHWAGVLYRLRRLDLVIPKREDPS